jgi:hypothetical protein
MSCLPDCPCSSTLPIADLLMGLLLRDVIAGSTKAEMKVWIDTTLSTTSTGTKAQLMDRMMTWAQQSAANNVMLIETVLAYRPHRYINFMVKCNGGKPRKRKSCAVAEFIRLDSLRADADANAGAGAGGADGAGDMGVVVPFDGDAPKKQRRLRRKLKKTWARLARRRIRSHRSRIIIDAIHWCLRNRDWTLKMIKQHVADKSGLSMDSGHHQTSRAFFDNGCCNLSYPKFPSHSLARSQIDATLARSQIDARMPRIPTTPTSQRSHIAPISPDRILTLVFYN